MIQSLFDAPKIQRKVYAPESTLPHNGTDTSRLAAEGQRFNKVARDRNAIMQMAGNAGRHGIIRSDCEDLDMTSGTYTARINKLAIEGYLIRKLNEDGSRARRPTRRGTPAEVLVASQHATDDELIAAQQEEN